MQPRFTHRESRLRTRTRSLVAVGALSALLLAGCGGGGSASTVTQPAVGRGAPAQGSVGRNSAPLAAPATPSVPGVSAGPAGVSKPGTPVVGVGPKLTKSASLDLQVKDISAAAARVRSIATGLQAQVLSEQIGQGSPGDPRPLQSGPDPLNGFGTLTLSVPADQLDTALDQLSSATIGTVLGRNVSSQDVTFQYVDTQSRLKTMRASVDRVRALMAQAKDLGQVVALESEMSQREADLESLESQLAELKTSVERSTLTVSLSTPGTQPVTNNGFVAGLRSGWDAFTASTSGLFTAIGAVLPFTVFFAVAGAPLVWWWRRRRSNRPPVGLAPGGLSG
jgi:Domain of unknown function (DUF4349)